VRRARLSAYISADKIQEGGSVSDRSGATLVLYCLRILGKGRNREGNRASDAPSSGVFRDLFCSRVKWTTSPRFVRQQGDPKTSTDLELRSEVKSFSRSQRSHESWRSCRYLSRIELSSSFSHEGGSQKNSSTLAAPASLLLVHLAREISSCDVSLCALSFSCNTYVDASLHSSDDAPCL